jgi:hypothetical protein
MLFTSLPILQEKQTVAARKLELHWSSVNMRIVLVIGLSYLLNHVISWAEEPFTSRLISLITLVG